jgi:LemA protein
MKKGVLVIVGLLVLVLMVVGSLVSSRNKLVAANESIDAAWAQVDNVLQRRADLIPNLVQTVKGYAKQEKDIFIQVAEARARLAGAKSINEKIQANQGIDSALSRLLVIVENYPQLKSNQNFMALQDELAGTENRIAVERMRFNESVKSYNLLVRLFPSNIAPNIFKFQRRDEYYEPPAAARELPNVKFD